MGNNIYYSAEAVSLLLTKQLVDAVHPAEDVESVVLLGAEIGDVGWSVRLLQHSARQRSHELLRPLDVGVEMSS